VYRASSSNARLSRFVFRRLWLHVGPCKGVIRKTVVATQLVENQQSSSRVVSPVEFCTGGFEGKR
jgi:hypothetical protein